MSAQSLKLQIDADITNKALSNSITPLNVGKNLKDIVDLVSNQISTILTHTANGDGITPIFIFPHGLSYTPTMVLATGNTIDTVSFFDGFNHHHLLFFAFADSTNITISYQNYDYYPKVPKIGLNNLKWTVLCK